MTTIAPVNKKTDYIADSLSELEDMEVMEMHEEFNNNDGPIVH